LTSRPTDNVHPTPVSRQCSSQVFECRAFPIDDDGSAVGEGLDQMAYITRNDGEQTRSGDLSHADKVRAAQAYPKPLGAERCRAAYRARRKVSCSALSSFVVLFHSNCYFSPGVSFFQIPDSLGDLTQAVTLVGDRRYPSGLHELMQGGQVLFARFR
jgi:hypothetical protein